MSRRRLEAAVAPDDRKSTARQKLGKRGKPASEEPPKVDAAKDEPAKDEPAKGETAKDNPQERNLQGSRQGRGRQTVRRGEV